LNFFAQTLSFSFNPLSFSFNPLDFSFKPLSFSVSVGLYERINGGVEAHAAASTRKTHLYLIVLLPQLLIL
jgi:hypothetical protein